MVKQCTKCLGMKKVLKNGVLVQCPCQTKSVHKTDELLYETSLRKFGEETSFLKSRNRMRKVSQYRLDLDRALSELQDSLSKLRKVFYAGKGGRIYRSPYKS